MSHLHWPFSLQLISHAKERVQHVQLQRDLRQHDPKRQVLATVFWVAVRTGWFGVDFFF